MRLHHFAVLRVLIAITACGGDDRISEPTVDRRDGVSVHWDGERWTPADIERGRRDTSWRRVVQLDSVAMVEQIENPEEWDHISRWSVNRRPMHLPLEGDVSGPSALRAQILLNRALFSPGIIDGRWGSNSEKAVYWFQRREGLPATGRLDRPTFERLVEVAEAPRELVRLHRLSDDDVAGPYITIPDDVYERAELACSCYETLEEKLAERFHTSPETLRQLNPTSRLNDLSAGESLYVPNIRGEHASIGARIAEIVVSGEGKYVHALGENGEIVFHFPATLGSQYDPSPTGEYRVMSVTPDPWWHYQPEILSYADDDKPEAQIPPGPNNAVGVVWMALNKPHYGIHGTNSPETIGYATSAGCVRLTNWDASFLSHRVRDGTAVTFRDT